MKKTIIITGIVIFICLGIISYFRYYSKSFSPESEVDFQADGLKVTVAYNRPYKKGRLIFGPPPTALVPYGRVWRTGANEATSFETNQDLTFNGKMLKAGTYSLWTIPGDQTWTVIFNSEYQQWGIRKWGIDYNGEANRDAKNDVLTLEVPSVTQDKVFEQFTISIEKAGEELEMILLWDRTLVAIPFSR